jgi:hypothetical protein
MKKPRDLDVELEALQRRAKALKERRVSQLGELVIAAGADRLEIETLAGALLAAVKADAAARDGWRRAGAAFFQGQARAADKDRVGDHSPAPRDGGAASG